MRLTACVVAVAAFLVPHPAVATTTAQSCHMRGLLPDAVCTPGVADPRVTQANIHSTICVKGYTATVRPPQSYTSALKRRQRVAYGVTGPAEEDHLISLELGGAPSDERNLWPEPGRVPNLKDKTENRLHAEVCAGTRTLVDAQLRIASDWTTA